MKGLLPAILLALLPLRVHAEPVAFVVHDGDIKNGSSVCSDEALQDILGVFRKSATPLV